ncbi:M23 family metallopeptidase [Alkalihalobacillus sp. TS-13]|uniref:M23 family metallopeptidase n=1 Tax=Alkalihalobacillus sp. TS-13 TaxID=2842455 RepID=UPI002892E103|nr:M23 family metallopeptidase [Alkalihalobacillus sp. TS-13]
MKSSLMTFAAAGLLIFSMNPGHSLNGAAGVTEYEENQIQKIDYRITPEEFGNAFLDSEFKKIYQQMSDEIQENVPYEDFKRMAESFNHGVKTYELASSFTFNKHMQRDVWIDDHNTKGMQVVYSKHKTIEGFQLAPLESYPETDQTYTENAYNMPIQDKWFVFWGGTNQLLNYHYSAENQRYAYDLVMMKNGSSYHGNPTKNKHYYAFGEKVTAPAAGKVVEVVDGIKDNVPGEMNSEKPLGNHVIIEHENGEYSLLAHFKEDSLSVEAGEWVEQDDLLGLCGNSGNSSEPHIHFQVMDSPDIWDAQSVRITFEKGNEPIQGDFITP